MGFKMSVLSEWIWDYELCCLDTAFCSSSLRRHFLSVINKITLENVYILKELSEFQLSWIALREMGARRLYLEKADGFLCSEHVESIARKTSRLTFVRAPTDMMLSIVKVCPYIVTAMIVDGSEIFSQLKFTRLRFDCSDISKSDSADEMSDGVSEFLESVRSLEGFVFPDISESNLLGLMKHFPDLEYLRCSESAVLRMMNLNRMSCPVGKSMTDNNQVTMLESLYLQPSRTDVTDDNVALISDCCPHLKELELGSASISDKSIIPFLQAHPQLRKLRTTNAGITNNALVACGSFCKNLKCLNVGGCERLDDTGLIAMAEGCCLLESISISTGFSDFGVTKLAERCLRLKHAVVIGVTEVSVSALLHCCPGLTALSVQCFLSPIVWSDLLARFSHFRIFKVYSTSLTFKGLLCGHEEGFSAFVARKLMDEILPIVLKGCLLLTELEVVSNEFSDEHMQLFLDHCPLIRKLSLINVCTARKMAIIVASSQRITSLEIVDSYFVDDSVLCAVVAAKVDLVSLNLECSGVSDVSLLYISAYCPRLRYLSVKDSCSVSAVGVVSVLLQCRDLRVIVIKNCVSLKTTFLLDHLRIGRYLSKITIDSSLKNDTVVDEYKSRVRPHNLGCLCIGWENFYPRSDL